MTARGAILAILIGAVGTACSTVREIKPAEYIPQHGPDLIWVTGADSTVMPLVSPHVEDSTLRGTLRGTEDTVRLPLANVRTVTAKVHDGKKTALFVIGLGTMAAAGLYVFAISKQGSQGGGVQCDVYQSTNQGGNPGSVMPFC
jgi:hypothetical protein